MYPKGRILRGMFAIKSSVWIEKGAIVDILQEIHGLNYYLIYYKEDQLVVPMTDVEILKYGI